MRWSDAYGYGYKCLKTLGYSLMFSQTDTITAHELESSSHSE
jgi:hypothetical protein